MPYLNDGLMPKKFNDFRREQELPLRATKIVWYFYQELQRLFGIFTKAFIKLNLGYNTPNAEVP